MMLPPEIHLELLLEEEVGAGRVSDLEQQLADRALQSSGGEECARRELPMGRELSHRLGWEGV